MERALLQGEREAERTLLQKEQKAVEQLQEKLVALETGIQKERDKVTHTWPGLAWVEDQWPGREGPWSPCLIIHHAGQVVCVASSGTRPLAIHGRYQLGGNCQGWGLWCLRVSSTWSWYYLWVPAIQGPPWPF